MTLTPRGLTILQLIASGRTSKQISDELRLEYGTVKNQLHHLYWKLGVSGFGARAKAAAWYARNKKEIRS